MLNSFNIIDKSQKLFFKTYGYVILPSQLTFKMKIELQKYVQDIEIDSLKKIQIIFINLNMILIIKKGCVEQKILLSIMK